SAPEIEAEETPAQHLQQGVPTADPVVIQTHISPFMAAHEHEGLIKQLPQRVAPFRQRDIQAKGPLSPADLQKLFQGMKLHGRALFVREPSQMVAPLPLPGSRKASRKADGNPRRFFELEKHGRQGSGRNLAPERAGGERRRALAWPKEGSLWMV